MLFTNRTRPQAISLNINGHSINEISETKFLGVMLDNKLSWDVHINPGLLFYDVTVATVATTVTSP